MKYYIKKILKIIKQKKTDPVIMDHSYVSSDSDIGDYTYIGFNCFITKAKVGRYCSIANNVSIGLGEHDMDEISTSSYFYDNPYQKLTQKECVIENDVWIGVDSIVRRGVRIGNGAVIGANSFVNEDVPDFAIVVGNPAKVIRYRFDSQLRVKILDSTWWNFDLVQAKKIIGNLKNHDKPN